MINAGTKNKTIKQILFYIIMAPGAYLFFTIFISPLAIINLPLAWIEDREIEQADYWFFLAGAICLGSFLFITKDLK